MKARFATDVRKARLFRIVLVLGCVTLLSALLYLFIPPGRMTWLGINTGRIRTTHSIFGVIVSEAIQPGVLTPLLEHYLGPLPEETEWEEASRTRYGLRCVRSDWDYESGMHAARAMAWLIKNERSSTNGARPLEYGMTPEAARECLRQFIIALHEQKSPGWVAEDYACDLGLYFDTGRKVEQSDVPSFAWHKVYGPDTEHVYGLDGPGSHR